MRSGKPPDIRDDGSGRRFDPLNDLEDRAAFTRHRARNIRGFWLQSLVLAFVSNDGLERSCNDKLFLRFCAFKKKLQSILMSSHIRLFKPNVEGQRKMAAGYSDRESRKISEMLLE